MKELPNYQGATFESAWAYMQECNRYLTEKQAETDRQMKETERYIKALQAETNREIKEIGREMKKLQKLTGGIANNNGEMAEEYFYRAFRRKKTFVNETFDQVFRNRCIKNGKWNAEFDLLLLNGQSVAIIEVKYRASFENIFMEKLISRIEPFKVLFPDYHNHKIYLGVAAMSFDKRLAKQLHKSGIATIHQEGKKMVVYDKELKAF